MVERPARIAMAAAIRRRAEGHGLMGSLSGGSSGRILAVGLSRAVTGVMIKAGREARIGAVSGLLCFGMSAGPEALAWR